MNDSFFDGKAVQFNFINGTMMTAANLLEENRVVVVRLWQVIAVIGGEAIWADALSPLHLHIGGCTSKP